MLLGALFPESGGKCMSVTTTFHPSLQTREYIHISMKIFCLHLLQKYYSIQLLYIFIYVIQILSLVTILTAYNEPQIVPQFTYLPPHVYSRSSGWNTRALTSMLSRAGASAAALGSTNAVCGTRLALPSVLLSKHLIKRTSSGVNPDL